MIQDTQQQSGLVRDKIVYLISKERLLPLIGFLQRRKTRKDDSGESMTAESAIRREQLVKYRSMQKRL